MGRNPSAALNPLTSRRTAEATQTTCDPPTDPQHSLLWRTVTPTRRDLDLQALLLQCTGPEDAVAMETAHACPPRCLPRYFSPEVLPNVAEAENGSRGNAHRQGHSV